MNRDALYVGIVSALFLGLVASFAFVCDDAFISFRYAQNWATGHGLRYNLAENPPVEGFSNLAWVALAALFELLHWDLTVAIPIVSVLCGLFVLARFARWCREDFGATPRAWLPPLLLLALLPPMAVWSTGGLATMPFALGLMALYEQLFRRARWKRVSLALAGFFVLTLRAEGFLWLLGLLGFAWWRRRRRETVVALTLAFALTAALFLARHAYFGEWLPLPVRVKSGLEAEKVWRGLQYALVFLLGFPGLAVAFAGLRRLPAAAQLFVLANVSYVVAIGGDFMAMGRVLIPSLPLLVMALWHALRAWLALRPAILAAGVFLAVQLASGYGYEWLPGFLHEPLHFRWNASAEERRSEYGQWKFMRDNARKWSELGKYLRGRSEPGDAVVLAAIGAVGYYSGLVVYDRVGLVSPEVLEAEDAGDELRSPGHDRLVSHRFFLSRRPRYLVVNIAPIDAQSRLQVMAGRLEQEFVNYPYRATVEPFGSDWVVLRLERDEAKRQRRHGS